MWSLLQGEERLNFKFVVILLLFDSSVVQSVKFVRQILPLNRVLFHWGVVNDFRRWINTTLWLLQLRKTSVFYWKDVDVELICLSNVRLSIVWVVIGNRCIGLCVVDIFSQQLIRRVLFEQPRGHCLLGILDSFIESSCLEMTARAVLLRKFQTRAPIWVTHDLFISIVKTSALLSHSLHSIRAWFSCCVGWSRPNTVLDFASLAHESLVLGLSGRVHLFLGQAFSAILSPLYQSATCLVVHHPILHPM